MRSLISVLLVTVCAAFAGSRPQLQLKVENGGLLFTDNPSGVSGTDGGYSIPMGSRTLWMFGDVFLYQPGADMRMIGAVSNCGLLVHRGKGTAPLRDYRFLTDPKTGLARQLLRYEPGENKTVRLWPGGGWYDSVSKRLYLYYQKVHTTGTGPLDFKVEGFGLARADASNPAALQLERLKADGRDVWWQQTSSWMFGCAVVHGSDVPEPYVYVVGVSNLPIKWASVARVRMDRISDRNSYEYFAGTPRELRWSKAASDATPIMGLEGVPNELSISYNRMLRQYVAVQSVGLSGAVRVSIAPNPWGPYSQLAEIVVPKQAFSKGFCYAAKEHPELAEDNGRIIYITYVDSSRYWLHLLKVTMNTPPLP